MFLIVGINGRRHLDQSVIEKHLPEIFCLHSRDIEKKSRAKGYVKIFGNSKK